VKRVGSLLWRAIRFEVRIYIALARWITRKPSIPAGAEPFGYGQGVTPVLWLWVFASVAEIPVVHVLLPWRTAQGIAFVVSMWGLAWMLGFLASHKAYPHLLTATGLVVRHGPHTRVEVPWSAVESVRAERRDLPSSARAWQPIDTTVRVGVSGETNIRLMLHDATVLSTSKGMFDATEVDLLVDDTNAFVAAVRGHILPVDVSATLGEG
jgi:hypothetical protein